MKHPYKLKNAMLMMALAAVYPMQSFAAAGVAQFSAGDVTLRRGTGADPLIKGRDIESGDAIVTGPTGRAQVRFSDGGLVSLQPNSQFNISKYADKNDAKEDSFLVDLLRGGMRAVTGLIGKRNHDNYKVTTQTATIGIRGSAFNLAYNPDGTLSVSTELDEIEVCTRAGCVGLKAGESALVVNAQDSPIRTSTRATLPTPPPRQEPQIVANNPALFSAAVVPTQPVPSKVIAGLAFAGTGQLPGTTPQVITVVGDGDYVFDKSRFDSRAYGNGTLVVNDDGTPEMYLASDNSKGQRTGTVTTVSKSGTVAGGDFMLLGTWSQNTWSSPSADSLTATNTAFVVGQPSSSTALSALVGQHADYNFTSGTPVYSTTGSSGTILENSKLTVDFLAAGNYITADINVRMPNATNQIPAVVVTTGPVTPSSTDYNLRGSATANGASFGGTLSVSSQNCVVYGYSCGTGSFNGFLSGDQANKAGVSFAADTGANGYINGAATFTRGGLTSTVVNNVISTGGMQVALMDTASGRYSESTYIGYGDLGNNSTGNDQFTFNGEQLVKYKAFGYNPQTTTVENTGSGGTFGSIGRLSDSAFIGWGNWVSATESRTSYGYSSGSTMLDAVHYVVGKPTALMPVTGQASYALIGGTSPTAGGYSVANQTGTLLGGAMNVNFGNGTVAVRVDTRFATGGDITINGSASFGSGNPTFSGTNYNNGTCTYINGIFVGTNAYRAGLVYGVDNTPIGRIAGSAAFQQVRSSGLSTTPVNNGGY